MSALRRVFGLLSRTPLHPQWLIGRRIPPQALRYATGVVLDIGAGDRWIERWLPEGAHYVALDYPATGQALYGARPDVFADAVCLPFDADTIDMVVALEVIEHVRSPDAMMAEVARVLKPGGRACLSMPFLYPVHDAPHDYQRWTRHGWSRSAGETGLEVVCIQPTGSAIEAAAVLCSLAIAGPLQGRPAWLVLIATPIVIPMVVMVNLAAWVLSRLWPAWDAMSTGIQVELRKP